MNECASGFLFWPLRVRMLEMVEMVEKKTPNP